MSEIVWRNLTKVLEEYGDEVIASYRRWLASSKVSGKSRISTITNSTGQLSETLDKKVTPMEGRMSLSLMIQEYWRYLEYGTGPQAGHSQYWPNPAAIERWIGDKPVVPFRSGGRIPTKKQLAFLIGRSIHEIGTPPLMYLDKSLLPESEIKARCEEAMMKDIEENLGEI